MDPEKVAGIAGMPGVETDRDYAAHLEGVRERISHHVGVVFKTDATGLWDAYLAAIPEADRQVHTCRACRKFVETYGGLVVITPEGRAAPLAWCESITPPYYLPAVAAVVRLVRRAKVTGLFLTDRPRPGPAPRDLRRNGPRLHPRPLGLIRTMHLGRDATMGAETKIEWCDHTANLWWGCEEVHAGCDHCYARVFATAKGKRQAWTGVRFGGKGVWAALPKWQAEAEKAGEIRRVFTGSMMDIFEKDRPVATWDGDPTPLTTHDLRCRYFAEVVPATPNLLHLLLTKRPGNIPKMVPPSWLTPGGWPKNVMTGTSPVNQDTADTLIPQLLRVPGPHFLSMEPLLGPVNLERWTLRQCRVCRDTVTKDRDCRCGDNDNGPNVLDWVIVGGESGPGARPCDLAWIRAIRDQCEAAGVPVFVKQLGAVPVTDSFSFRDKWPSRIMGIDDPRYRGFLRIDLSDKKGGDWSEWKEDLRVREFPEVAR